MPHFDIDLVYLWVDGNDMEWVAKKNIYLGKHPGLSAEATTKARNANNEELKYSLRSAAKYAPWVRNIFIVTDGQTPNWLNLRNEQIKVIDIRSLIPVEALPCYNSVIIEHFLYKIPGLSERFLYANDDMFFNRPITPDFFFNHKGLPIVRLQYAFCGKWKLKLKDMFNLHTNIYRRTINRAALLIEEKFGKYYSGVPHHNIDAYLKSDYQAVSADIFVNEIGTTIENHLRSEDDIQRVIYLYYALAVKRGVLRYVGRRESCRIRLYKPDFINFLERYNPFLFCLNDSHHATDEDRMRVEPFLRKLYPGKSSYEL